MTCRGRPDQVLPHQRRGGQESASARSALAEVRLGTGPYLDLCRLEMESGFTLSQLNSLRLPPSNTLFQLGLQSSQTNYTSIGTLAMPRRRALTEVQLETMLVYAPGDGRDMLAWLLPVALATTNALAVAAALRDELRRRQIVVPGPSVIERLIAAVLVVAERHVAGQLTRNLSSANTDALDALPVSQEGTAMSVLAWVRQPPGAPGHKTLKRIVEQLARLRAVGLDPACAGRASRTAAETRLRGRPLHRPASACPVVASPQVNPGCDRAGHQNPPD